MDSYNRGRYKPPVKKVTWKEGSPCNICGQPVMQKHLSKDNFKKEYEMRWCVHYACQQKMLGVLDRNTR